MTEFRGGRSEVSWLECRAVLLFRAAVVLITLILGFLAWQGYQGQKREAGVVVANLADLLVNVIETSLDRARSDLNVFKAQLTPADLSGQASRERRREWENHMREHLITFPSVANYRIFNAEGVSLFSAGDAGQDNQSIIDVSGRDWFRALKERPDSPYVLSEVLTSLSTGQQTIILGLPVRNRQGALAGVVVAALNLAHLQGLVDHMNVGPNGLVAVRRADDSRLILRRPRAVQQLNEKVVGASGAVFTMRKGDEIKGGDFVSPVDGISRTYATRPVRSYGLRVLVAVAQQDYMADWRIQTVTLGAVSLLLLVGLLAAQRSQSAQSRRLEEVNQALAVSEVRYHTLFEGARLPMLLTDPVDGRIVDANRAAVDFYGWGADLLRGMNMADISAQSRHDIDVQSARVLSGEQAVFHAEHRLAEGGIRRVEAHCGTVNLDGRTLVCALILDVTDEQRLRSERQRLFLAIEQSPASVVITNREGLIEYVNPAFSRVTGYGVEDVLGQNPRLLKSGETSDAEYKAMWEQLSAGTPWAGIFHNRRKSGELYWEKAQISPIKDEEGVITHFLAVKEDISLQRQTEARLEETLNKLTEREQRLELLADLALEGIVIHDGTSILDVTPAFCRIFGYERDELISSSLRRLMTDDAAPVIERRIRENATDSYEVRLPSKDGSLFWAEIYGRPVSYLGLQARVARVRDITLRKEVEAELRQSEERFRSLVEGTADWIWETDEQHRFSWFSPSFDLVLGFPSESLLGRRRWDVVSDTHEIESPRWEAHIADLSAHRPFRDFQYWIRTGEGTAKWISISGAPRFDASGHFKGYRGVGREITEQAAAAMRLRLLSKVVEQSPVSVVITDPMGRIDYVNGHFCRSTGYGAEEVLGRNCRLLASGQTPGEVYRDMWATITKGEVWSGELLNRKKDGSPHWELISISPVRDDEDKIACYAAVKDDITFRKESEARIAEANAKLAAQARLLESSNAELEQFAYVVSHDLRQPLRSVSSYVTLLGRSLAGRLSEDESTFMGFVHDGAVRMDRLIVDLLEYSRVGRGDQPAEPLDMGEIVKEALQNLEFAIHDAGARIGVADEMPHLVGHRGELVRLFQNLIGNAVKYHAPDRLPVVTVACRREGQYWELSVSDNGIGIDPRHHDRVFGIFQRLVSREAYEGTGIGLAICRKIVEHHKGRIWVESAEGEGSTFRLILPVSQQEQRYGNQAQG